MAKISFLEILVFFLWWILGIGIAGLVSKDSLGFLTLLLWGFCGMIFWIWRMID